MMEYRYYWTSKDYKKVGMPNLVYQGKEITIHELCEIIGLKYVAVRGHILAGATRYKDFKWDIDFEVYHARCVAWEAEEEARKIKAWEDRRSHTIAVATRMEETRANRSKMTKTESQRRWEASSFQKLKESIPWEIRGQEIPKGSGRVYFDGNLSTRETVFKALGLSDRIFCMLLKVGNFTYKGHKIELRKPEKVVPAPKPKRIPFTKEEIKERARLCEKARKERRKLLEKASPHKACMGIAHTIEPYGPGLCSKNSTIHVNGVKTGREEASRITGLSQTWIRNRVSKGVILVNGFRIELLKNSSKRLELRPPEVRPAGKKYQVRLNYNGKKYVWFCGTLEQCERKLAEILINDKWREKVNGL
jgi:hypothetical protein